MAHECGCSSSPRPTSRTGRTPTGEALPGGHCPSLAAYREAGGVPVLCDASAALNPVTGILRGDASASAQPVWLEAESGRRLSIIWPAGFTVRFEPVAMLRNQLGAVVARDGDRIRLGQVGVHESQGTFEDPYVAHGIAFDGCYPYVTSLG